MQRENSIRHAAIQHTFEHRVLEMIRQATSAGGFLTASQIRERTGVYSGRIYEILQKLKTKGLIDIEGRDDLRGVHSIRFKK